MENIMSSKLLSTRRGTVILGIAAAVLAAIVLLVYLNQYRNSVNSNAEAVSVLVAKSLIQKGTPGDVVGSTGMYQVTSLPKKELKAGAFIDPKTLTGKVAAADIYPGQQLTTADFVVGNAAALTQNLARDQRAVVIPLDNAAEVGGQILAGDHVDVWVAWNAQQANGSSKPVVQLVLQNMYVMNATGGSLTFRATSAQAGKLIYASQQAKVWLTLRPTVGTTTKAPVITASDLVGTPSIR
jgi:Flp pilus assembly protein CpaB